VTSSFYGSIKIWNADRGFGFLKRDDYGAPDAFLHKSTLREEGLDPDPSVGIRYSFDIKAGRDGRPAAFNLKPID